MKKQLLQILFLIIVILIAASGCSYYSCDIAGYVRDDESDAGINGVLVRVYLSEPASLDDENYIVETTTMTSGGNDGYFSHKVFWQTSSSAFGEEGDSGEVYIIVQHEDYTSVMVRRSGLISDTLNVVADIKVKKASFTTALVQGKVVNVNGDGVNGINVVLDLKSTTDDERDYINSTATVNGEDGIFQFNNVTWRDDSPDTASVDTEEAGIYIDDSNYDSDTNLDAQRLITITSDQDFIITDNPVSVTRKPQTDFQADLQGACFYRQGTAPDIQELGISGVEVTVTYIDDSGTNTFYTTTNNNGNYSFTINWTEDPPTDNGTGLTIPEGEDVIEVDITFSSNSSAGNVYSFEPITGNVIKSWLNPNTLPDRVDLDPNS